MCTQPTQHTNSIPPSALGTKYSVCAGHAFQSPAAHLWHSTCLPPPPALTAEEPTPAVDVPAQELIPSNERTGLQSTTASHLHSLTDIASSAGHVHVHLQGNSAVQTMQGVSLCLDTESSWLVPSLQETHTHTHNETSPTVHKHYKITTELLISSC